MQECSSSLPKIGLFVSVYSDSHFPHFLQIPVFPQGRAESSAGTGFVSGSGAQVWCGWEMQTPFSLLESKYHQWEGARANPEIINIIIQIIPIPKCITPFTLSRIQGSQTPGGVRTEGATPAWREATILLENGNLMH